MAGADRELQAILNEVRAGKLGTPKMEVLNLRFAVSLPGWDTPGTLLGMSIRLADVRALRAVESGRAFDVAYDWQFTWLAARRLVIDCCDGGGVDRAPLMCADAADS